MTPIEWKSNYATYIKQTRKALGLSQMALAMRLGKTLSTVCRWEQGGHVPEYTVYLALEAMRGKG